MFCVKNVVALMMMLFYFLSISFLVLGQFYRLALENKYFNGHPEHPLDYSFNHYRQFALRPLKPKRQPIFNLLRPIDIMRGPGRSYFGQTIKDYKPKIDPYSSNLVRRSNSSDPNSNLDRPCENCSWIPPLMYYGSHSPFLSSFSFAPISLFKRDSLYDGLINRIETKLLTEEQSKFCRIQNRQPSKLIENYEWIIKFDFPITCAPKNKAVKCYCEVN